jgi:6-phosphofructokinase 1
MGRNAGWIALQAGIAGGADVILIPEIPYNLEVVAEKVEARNQRGAKFSIIVVAEGARPAGGEAVYQAERDIGGMQRLGGIGEVLARQLKERCKVNVRVTVLGHLQRGGSPSAFDRLLASRFGTMAVHLVAQGKMGHMVALQGEDIVAVPLERAISRQKFVPLDSDYVLTALGLDICLGDTRHNILARASQPNTNAV